MKGIEFFGISFLWRKYSLIFFILLASNQISLAQSFHRALSEPENLFSQRILRNDDGSYFIGDSFLTNGEIFISRFFKCGELDWSRSYRIGGAFIEFRDFAKTSSDELIAFGSYFVGNKELIFVQKIDQESGVQISFSTIDPVYQDHFTYSIDIQNEEILLFGLLLDFNIERRGFVGVLDEGLNIKWSKEISPFQKEGFAVISDDGFYCRSNEYHIKFDSGGEVLWSRLFTGQDNDIVPIGGPKNTSGGHIYEATIDGQNFFYKLDEQGSIVWKSQLFMTTGVKSTLNQLDNGDFLVSYYGLINNRTVLAQMQLSTTGNLSGQKFFDTDEEFASGSLQVSIYEDNMTIVGSPEPFTNFPDAYQDFILQVDPEDNSLCYPMLQYNDLESNTFTFTLEDYILAVEDFELVDIGSSTLTFEPYDISFDDICMSAEPVVPEEEFLNLECGSSLLLELPSDEYLWDDLGTSDAREVEEPGFYQARSQECEDSRIVAFTVTSPDCDCNIFFPSALSPNSDGFNDDLNYFSDCEISSIQISVFNRWGEKVYFNNVLGQFWSPSNITDGVYLLVADIEVLGPNGQLISKELIQSLTILK